MRRLERFIVRAEPKIEECLIAGPGLCAPCQGQSREEGRDSGTAVARPMWGDPVPVGGGTWFKDPLKKVVFQHFLLVTHLLLFLPSFSET